MKRTYCNKCGKKLDIWDLQMNFFVQRNLGYGSKYDGESVEFDLCCSCVDWLIEKCKISPIRGGHN